VPVWCEVSSRSHFARRARAALRALGVAVGLSALTAGCNALLGNGEVERDLLDARPDPREASVSTPPSDLDGAASAPTLPGDAAADATTACPSPTCATSADCPAPQVCVSMGDGDGGARTRACRATCEAGAGCAANESCVTGDTQSACIPTGTACYASCKRVCGTSCVDWLNDRAHCGRCGTACPAGKSCVGGACT
jgi:hypothetical protein